MTVINISAAVPDEICSELRRNRMKMQERGYFHAIFPYLLKAPVHDKIRERTGLTVLKKIGVRSGKGTGGVSMARTVAIGLQDFAKVITNDCFYVDKTDFIREWWESSDAVTLITRPRRFRKTLNLSMLECFFL